MRKLKLSLDDLRVATFETDAAGAGNGMVYGHQTQPDTDGGACTGARCTYPVQLCHPRKADEKPADGKR